MKKRLLSPHPLSFDTGLFVLRVSVGSLMLLIHGWPKLMNFGEKADSFANVLGMGSAISLTLAVFAEVFCSALVVLGLFTRLALMPLLILLLVAIFIVHAGDPLDKIEKALLYLIPFFTLFLTGPGKYSLDQLIKPS